MALRDVFDKFMQPMISAASLRAPMRSEVYPITCGTTSKRFAVPDAWKGSIVNVQADGADVYIQVSTATDAACDRTARAGESGSGTLTLATAAAGCWKVAADQTVAIPIPLDALTFALHASADASCARLHLAET